MEFWSFVCDQLSEVQFEACNLCSLYPPTNPVLTACGHCFCWPCMHQFMQEQVKPCPACFTMLSSDANVVPTFDSQGAMVLRLPTADGLERSWDDDWSDTAAFASAARRSEEERSARRDPDMPVPVVLDIDEDLTTYDQW